jgi:hypothetical protein
MAKNVIYSNYDYDINPYYASQSRYHNFGHIFTIKDKNSTRLKIVDVNKVKKNSGGYVIGKETKAIKDNDNNKNVWGILEPIEFENRNDDVYYIIEKQEDGRPDKISYKFYQTPRLFWVILYANSIFDPFQEIVTGLTIRVPSIEHVLTKIK